MAAGCAVIAALAIGPVSVDAAAAAPAVPGLDVSDRQPIIDWSLVAAAGAQFAYIKATEGTGLVNADFTAQYNGAHQAGLIRGAYHFALPSQSSGAAQASYFVANGGGWIAYSQTLPGALDIEYNPYGPECYGLSQTAMVAWIASFTTAYQSLTGVYPVIYTPAAWWATCTGNYGGFAGLDAVWITSPGTTAGALPSGWSTYTFWQYASSGTFPGDQDAFNGSTSQLQLFAADDIWQAPDS
jgi:GH25 family lysozyme M1 (1,4-beta-N-acetylmuramidase)